MGEILFRSLGALLGRPALCSSMLVSLCVLAAAQNNQHDATAEAVHEWWCTHPGRSETAPCLHHSFVQQHKAVCGEGERSSDCLRLEEEHEMYMRERQDLASDQAQSREMHDAWCARPENDGTGFCEGWREWKAGQGRGDRDEL